MIRAGFGMFDDRYNMTFFYVPNTQKVAPGYLCGNHASSATAGNCSSPGPLPIPGDPQPKPVLPQNLPMILNNLGQASQGYQLFAFPGGAGASAYVDSIITNGDYVHFEAINPVVMAGTCGTTLACGVGSGGMDLPAGWITV